MEIDIDPIRHSIKVAAAVGSGDPTAHRKNLSLRGRRPKQSPCIFPAVLRIIALDICMEIASLSRSDFARNDTFFFIDLPLTFARTDRFVSMRQDEGPVDRHPDAPVRNRLNKDISSLFPSDRINRYTDESNQRKTGL
jgi:hypothetical protein